MLDVCLLGTGGMMPLPGRALSSLLMRYNGRSILVDCGEGTQISLRKSGWGFKAIDTICITHFYGDHILGLPGMLLSIGNAKRNEPITIAGPAGIQDVVESLLVVAPHLPFDIEYVELTEDDQNIPMHDDTCTLKAFRVDHTVECYGFSLDIPRGGKFDVSRAVELDIPREYWSVLQRGENVYIDDDGDAEPVIYTPDMVLGVSRRGIKLVYTTDTRPCRSIADNACGADLLICEGMYGDDGKLPSAQEKKHMLFTEAAALASEAKAHELWLTHYSPSMPHPKHYVDEAIDIFANTRVVKDRYMKTLAFRD